eukprot:gene8286-11216_t
MGSSASTLISTIEEELELSPILRADFATIVNLLNDRPKKTAAALEKLLIISYKEKNNALIGSPYSGIVPEISHALKIDTYPLIVKKTAMAIVYNLTLANENKEYLGSKRLGLVYGIVHRLKDEDDEIFLHALRSVHNLSSCERNKPFLGSDELGLINLLVYIAKTQQHDAINEAMLSLWNLSKYWIATIPNQSLMLSLVNSLQRKDEVTKFKAMETLSYMAENGTTEDILALLKMKAHITILRMIREVGPDRVYWDGIGYISMAITFLMNLARCPLSVIPLKRSDTINYMLPIIRCLSNGVECIKATFIIIFLIGKEELALENLSLPDLDCIEPLEMIIHLLRKVVEVKDTDDLTYTIFNLRLLLSTIIVLLVSDHNKAKLSRTPLLKLLLKILNAFINNDPPYINVRGISAGGGGEDLTVAELAIESMLQFSFIHSSNADLQSQLMTTESGVFLVMNEVSKMESLGLVARQHASMLMFRLSPLNTFTHSNPTTPKNGRLKKHSPTNSFSESMEFNRISRPSSASSSPQHRNNQTFFGSTSAASSLLSTKQSDLSHIFLSYDDTLLANCEIVYELRHALIKSGYDVWTHKEGSSICKASGQDEDHAYHITAAAISLASSFIICVSHQYKESASLHMEANHLFQLSKYRKIRIHYVMLQHIYTPLSKNIQCDGWLGDMVISNNISTKTGIVNNNYNNYNNNNNNEKAKERIVPNIWYPLWDTSKLNSTVDNIIKSIGNTARLEPTSTSSTFLPSFMVKVSSSNSLDSNHSNNNNSNDNNQNDDERFSDEKSIQLPVNKLKDLNIVSVSDDFDNIQLKTDDDIHNNNNYLSNLHSTSPLTLPQIQEDQKYTIAYSYLSDTNRIQNISEMNKKLQILGIFESEDLLGLASEDIMELSLLFKKAQRKKFLELFELN